MRRALLDALDRRLDPRIVAGLGSVYLTARARTRCAVRYDEGQWIHRYRDGVVVNTRLGGLSARWQDEVTRDVFLFGYEPRPGDTVFDIGAGVGGEVRLLSRLVGPVGRVVSVEAHPRTAACLRRTVALNRLTNVSVLECAVVGAPGPVHLADDPVAHIRNAVTTDAAAGVQVAGRTLDEIIASLGVDRVDLLKMNIEGAELGVLDGARHVLGMIDNVAVSCHDFLADEAGAPDDHGQRTFAPVTALLRDAGFSIRTRPDDARPWIRNYVYGSRRPTPPAVAG